MNSRRKKSHLIQSFFVSAAVSIAMISTGVFGTAPANWVTEAFQQGLQDHIPSRMQSDFADFVEFTDAKTAMVSGEAETAAPLEALEPAPEMDTVEYDSTAFPLKIPIPSDYRDVVDFSERFGVPQSKEVIQHGSDFINSIGTPVIAAQAGTVIFAGDDQEVEIGPEPNFYGLTIVIKHTIPKRGTIYTLYAQLSEVLVAEGDSVTAGAEIGKVGNSGNTSGSELHFEVRAGENSYEAVRNPELWLVPRVVEGQPLNGALAGRIVTTEGEPIAIQGHIVIRSISDPDFRKIDLQTYTGDDILAQSPWEETFGVGELPPGEYSLAFYLAGNQKHVIEIRSGELTQWELVHTEGE